MHFCIYLLSHMDMCKHIYTLAHTHTGSNKKAKFFPSHSKKFSHINMSSVIFPKVRCVNSNNKMSKYLKITTIASVTGFFSRYLCAMRVDST